jgi:hypothetical protein
MHGHSRSVERKIRLWIAQQESNRRMQARLDRREARVDAPLQRLARPGETRPHRGPSR